MATRYLGAEMGASRPKFGHLGIKAFGYHWKTPHLPNQNPTQTFASSHRQPFLPSYNSNHNVLGALPNHQWQRQLDLALLPPTLLPTLHSLPNLLPRSPPNHMPSPHRQLLGTNRRNTATLLEQAFQRRQGLSVHARWEKRARGFGYRFPGVPEEGSGVTMRTKVKNPILLARELLVRGDGDEGASSGEGHKFLSGGEVGCWVGV